MTTLLGIDTGGTFTDFVLFEGGRLRIHKVLSTPEAPERAILQGIAELGLGSDGAGAPGLAIVHGSTVATNAVLEGKGVATVFITNRGFGDMLTLGRQTRAALYDLQPPPRPAPVPPDHCLETGGRLGADGGVIEPLTETDLAELAGRVAALAPRAVAINLLFSYLDDSLEQRIAAAMPEGLFVSRSSAVLPEYREYERGVTTWLNAWVGPLVEGYLGRLQAGVPTARVSVMQSAGGTVAADQAGAQAVNMLLSGPAGGLAGAGFVGRASGCQRLLSFDMGGTSTDVALLEGEAQLTTEGTIGGYPVAVPMVDMHTIGAGGGSIASVDIGGLLQVGPASAGADPGPACYGRGGRAPTVTDANLVLGRLRSDAFLGGGMALDSLAAERAVGEIGQTLGLDPAHAALGIVRLANEHMARALRVMSVQRGIDPRGLTLVSFGGAGGLHVCALAEALGMRRALVPVHAGVLSALGMLVAPRARHLSRTVNAPLSELPVTAINTRFDELIERGGRSLEDEGVSRGDIEQVLSLDLRYRGQSYFLNVPWEGPQLSAQHFHDLHERRYGHRLDLPVELVNVRAELRAAAPAVALEPLAPGEAAPIAEAALVGIETRAPVYARAMLGSGQSVRGPALITETVSTTYLAPGWYAEVDAVGNLLLSRGE
ncbi:MAG: hydantoinase/oxoprolinase family protein [Gammaproteobacteria bacterium]